MVQNSQALPGLPGALSFPFCVPRARVAYDYPLDTLQGLPQAHSTREASSAPPCASAFVYLGPEVDRFIEVFSAFGTCIKGEVL